MFDEYNDVIDVNDVKEMLHVGRSTVFNLMSSGRLPYMQVNKRKYLYRKLDVIRLFENEVNNYEQEHKKDTVG